MPPVDFFRLRLSETEQRLHCGHSAPARPLCSSCALPFSQSGFRRHTPAQRRRCATLLICKRLCIPERSRGSSSKRERIRKKKGRSVFHEACFPPAPLCHDGVFGVGGRWGRSGGGEKKQRRENSLQSNAHVLARLLKVFVRNPLCAPALPEFVCLCVCVRLCVFVCAGETSR